MDNCFITKVFLWFLERVFWPLHYCMKYSLHTSVPTGWEILSTGTRQTLFLRSLPTSPSTVCLTWDRRVRRQDTTLCLPYQSNLKITPVCHKKVRFHQKNSNRCYRGENSLPKPIEPLETAQSGNCPISSTPTVKLMKPRKGGLKSRKKIFAKQKRMVVSFAQFLRSAVLQCCVVRRLALEGATVNVACGYTSNLRGEGITVNR